MANIFSPQEILRIAVKVEENGKGLYQALEEKAKNEKLKAMWKYLKEQEELHRKVFAKMLDEAGDFVVSEFNPGEYGAYLDAIAKGYVFTQKLIDKKKKELFKSDLEAIDFGLYIEKESILTYTALSRYILDAKKNVLEKVIDEERRHLVQLSLLKDTLK